MLKSRYWCLFHNWFYHNSDNTTFHNGIFTRTSLQYKPINGWEIHIKIIVQIQILFVRQWIFFNVANDNTNIIEFYIIGIISDYTTNEPASTVNPATNCDNIPIIIVIVGGCHFIGLFFTMEKNNQ